MWSTAAEVETTLLGSDLAGVAVLSQCILFCICPAPVYGICLYVQAKGIARRLTPILVGVREEVVSDMYTLVRSCALRAESHMHTHHQEAHD